MTTYTLFGQATETVSGSGAGNNGTNGLHFTVSSACTLEGLWHYSPSGQGQTQLPTTIGLYTTQSSPTSGTLVTSNAASWSGAAGSGWVFASFTSPPSLVSGTNYMATQFRNDATNGWFVYDDSYTWPASNGILTAPKDTGTGQGWYDNNTTADFPTSQLPGYNFWMDVSVSTSSGNTSTGALAFNPAISASGTVSGPFTSTAALSFRPGISASGLVPYVATAAMSFRPAMAGTGGEAVPVTATGSMSFSPAISASGISPYVGSASLSFSPAIASTGTVSGPFTSTAAMSFRPSAAASGTVANPVTATAAITFTPGISGHGSSGITATGAMSFSPVMAGSAGITRTLLMSLAPAAGTDIYGNSYPAGFYTSQGNIEGSTIQGSTFEGTNWLENDDGQFMYKGTPANGNMLLSVAPASGTDQWGNVYQPGFTVFNGPDAYVILNVNDTADAPALGMTTGASFESGNASLYTFPVGSGSTAYIATRLQSASSVKDDVNVGIEMYSNYASASGGTPQGQLAVGSTVSASWDSAGFHATGLTVNGTSIVPAQGTPTTYPLSGSPTDTTYNNTINAIVAALQDAGIMAP